MNGINTFLIIITCCILGYVAKLYMVPPAVVPAEVSSGVPAEIQPVEVIEDVPVEEDNSEAEAKERARLAARRAKEEAERAAARARELARLAEMDSFVHEPEPESKEAFPVTSIQLDRFDRRSPTGSPQLEKAIQFAIENNRFEDLGQLLKNELYKPVQKKKEIEARDIDELEDNPIWNHGVNVYTMLQFFSAEDLGQAAAVSEHSKKFYFGILTHPEAMTQLLYNLSPHDDLAKALLIWQDIWLSEKDEEIRTKYLNLAIACSLVFDVGKIKPKNDYDPIDAISRYTLFRKNAEAHRLKTTLSMLEVSDLVWVVDVALNNEEIEWAVRHAHFRRRGWGKAYGHIEYLMERAVNGENPYENYTLAQIEKHGGICGDQTYFSVNTAKANGIPATGVSGTGDRGGHAWLAYKPNEDEWNTTTGRYENYSNGSVRNSQTNQRMAEFDLMLLSDRKMKSKRVREAKTLLRFVSILETMKHDKTGIRQTLDEVLDRAPLLVDSWTAYVAFLEKQEPELTQKEWQKVIDTIERTFKKHPTMWMTAREITQKHIWKHLDEDDIEKTQSRYRSEIARKFPGRGDMIRQVLEDQEAMILKKGDFAKIRSFYRQAFRYFGKDTLNFKFISEQYFKVGEKFPDDRDTICNDIENYFSRHVDKESGDYFKAKTEIAILKTISKYYGEIGDQRKKKKYSDEAAKRLKKSKKRAL